MQLKLEVKRYHEFFWLRDIRNVNIHECCAKCFIGGKDNRVYYGTLYQSHAVIDIEVIEHPEAKAYYLCGLSAGFNWHENTHVAFVPAPDETVFMDNENIKLVISGARRVDFQSEGYAPNPQGWFTDKQRTCRNWIFANYVKDGLLPQIGGPIL